MSSFYRINTDASMYRFALGATCLGVGAVAAFSIWLVCLPQIDTLTLWLMIFGGIVLVVVMINNRSANLLTISLSNHSISNQAVPKASKRPLLRLVMEEQILDSAISSKPQNVHKDNPLDSTEFSEIFIQRGSTNIAIDVRHLVLVCALKYGAMYSFKREFEKIALFVYEHYQINLYEIPVFQNTRYTITRITLWGLNLCVLIGILLSYSSDIFWLATPFVSIVLAGTLGYIFGTKLAENKANICHLLISDGRCKVIVRLKEQGAEEIITWFANYLAHNRILQKNTNIALNPYAARASFGAEPLESDDTDIVIIPY